MQYATTCINRREGINAYLYLLMLATSRDGMGPIWVEDKEIFTIIPLDV